jgi:hypothetical protein
MCLYTICKGYIKRLGPKLKKNLSSLPRASSALCREAEWPALGKGCWPGPSFRPRDICRVLAQALGKRPPLCREPNSAALYKGDNNGSRSRRGSFAESLSLPRACLCQSWPLPRACLCREQTLGKAGLCRESGFAESLAVGKGSLSSVLVGSRQRQSLPRVWLSAKLGPRQSSRFV